MLTNTFVNELFIANLGNDTLTGNGGTDVFYVGNNWYYHYLNANNFTKLSNYLLARVDGGNTDTLKLAST